MSGGVPLGRVALRRVVVDRAPARRYVGSLSAESLRELVAGRPWALRNALEALNDDREALLVARLLARKLVGE